MRLPFDIGLPTTVAVKGLEVEMVVELFHENLVDSRLLRLEVDAQVSQSIDVEQLSFVDGFDGLGQENNSSEEALLREQRLESVRHVFQVVTFDRDNISIGEKKQMIQRQEQTWYRGCGPSRAARLCARPCRPAPLA